MATQIKHANESRNLSDLIVNDLDSTFYLDIILPVINRLKSKYLRGNLKDEQAQKEFYHVARLAAKKYACATGNYKKFTVTDCRSCAAILLDYYGYDIADF